MICGHRITLVLAIVACASVQAVAGEPDAAGIAFFETKIRPVLVEHCYKCHSQPARDSGAIKGGLLLDTREELRRGGESGPAIIPGDPNGSLLVTALRHESFKMPPAGKLPEKVIADFAAWVQMGAPDPRDSADPKPTTRTHSGRDFWSFQPLKSHRPPKVKNAGWGRNPVDAFIVEKLEAAGISPSDAVDRRTLIRRVCFDLIGLPPDPEEVESFIRDPAPDAYSRLVDRLLNSPGYGERWARHWLDLSRFMESNAAARDYDRPGAYFFRDFVIRALNDDLAYDEFVRLQIAGDLMNGRDEMSRAATGFLASGPYDTEVSLKERERSRYDQLDDVLSTIGTSMLGLTIGCARCHDHKYDPIPSEDYYSMIASFATLGFNQIRFEQNRDQYRAAKAEFDKAHQPFIDARTAFERDVLPGRFAAWEKSSEKKGTPQWVTLIPSDMSAVSGASLRVLLDGSVLVEGPNPDEDNFAIHCDTKLTEISGFRIEALPDPTLPGNGPGRGENGSFALSEMVVRAKAKTDTGDFGFVDLLNARPSVKEDESTVGAAIDRMDLQAWIVDRPLGRPRVFSAVAKQKVAFDQGINLMFALRFIDKSHRGIGRFRLSAFVPKLNLESGMTADSVAVDAGCAPPAVFDALRQEAPKRGREAQESLFRWFGQLDPEWRNLCAREEAHYFQRPRQEFVSILGASTNGATYAYPDRYKAFVLVRGEPDNKKGPATPGFLRVLMADAKSSERWTAVPANPKQSTRPPRVAFANWLTDVDYGAGTLLARVIVNRMWQHHFGRGIVGTSNDFGTRGELPTHPELLDYLAKELIRGGWKLKPIHKLMMGSAAYMQSSKMRADAQQVDPGNRLLWRRVPLRLEAETIRDTMLYTSGTLDRSMMGPGTLDEHSTRRSVYFTVKRNQPIPFLQLFDTPYVANGVGERQVSTTPVQALAMMNSPTVREFSEKLARRLWNEPTSAAQEKVERVWEIVLSRPVEDDERERISQMIAGLSASHGPAPDARERAFADFCQMLFCCNEFFYVD